MRSLKISNHTKIAFLLLLLSPVYAFGNKTAEDVAKSINSDINKTRAVEQQKEAKAEKYVMAAKDLFVAGKFKEAIDQYLEAVKTFKAIGVGGGKPFQKKIDYCREQIYQCYYHWAMNLVEKIEDKSQGNDYAEAIKLCEQAAEIYPPCKKKMQEKIKKFTILRNAASRKHSTSEAKLIPSKKENTYDTEVLLKQADVLKKAGRLELAKAKYEEILLNDIYNSKAIEGLRVINKELVKIGTRRLYTQDKERTNEVVWELTTPIVPKVSKDDRRVITVPEKKFLPVSKIRQKLKSIVIPRIDFEDITVETAVSYIREQSKQLDPEGVGINIFLRLKAPKVKDSALDDAKDAEELPEDALEGAPEMAPGGEEVAVAAEDETEDDFEDDEDFEEDEEDEEETGDIGKKVVNLVLEKSNLYKAIYFLCKTAGLKFRIEKYAVVIAAKNIPLDDLETKVFPVEQGSLAVVGGDDSSSLKDYFKNRGIKFPNGARIVYDSRISRLIATNTLENLQKIEGIIQNELSSKDPMVQIQAKFIEITQDDLKELGFNWTVSNTPASTNGTVTLQPSSTSLGSITPGEDSSPPTILQYTRSTDDGFNLTFDLNALNQVDSTNLLSSPRITTMNGREASVRMVREEYFPDDYTEAKTTTTTGREGGDTYSFIGSIPEFSDPTELGIILRVIPDVDLEHRTITMRVNPTVQALVRWTEYNYQVTFEGATEPQTVVIRKPVIAARTIDTKITIYDGETIVLGGILRDTTRTLNDRVPLLGDIPFIGRFFQSRATQSEKTNLLIFLTCRLVKPDGTAFFPDVRPEGLPKFNRLR